MIQSKVFEIDRKARQKLDDQRKDKINSSGLPEIKIYDVQKIIESIRDKLDGEVQPHQIPTTIQNQNED